MKIFINKLSRLGTIMNNNKKILNEVDLLSLGLGAAAAGGAAYLGKKAIDAYRRRKEKQRAESPEGMARAAKRAESAERSRAARALRTGEGHDVIPGTDIKLTPTQLFKLNEHGKRQRNELLSLLQKVSGTDHGLARTLADRVHAVWPEHQQHGFLPHGENSTSERAKVHGDIMSQIKTKFPQFFTESYSNNLSTNDPSVKMLMERFNYYLRN
jgi:hypothetical protein